MIKLKQKEISKSLKNYTNREFEFHNSFKKSFEKYFEIKLTGENIIFKAFLESLILDIYEELMQIDLKIVSANDKYSPVLAKQYIKSNFLIKQLLGRCQYYDCAVLIRKQFESATRLKELNNKKADQLVLKTPNMSNTFNRVFNSIKKELSEYTHVSSLEKLTIFNDLTTDYFNEYNKVIYNKFIDYINQCHIAMLTAFLAFSNNLVPDSKMEIFDKYFAFSLRYGIDEGVLNIESNKK